VWDADEVSIQPPALATGVGPIVALPRPTGGLSRSRRGAGVVVAGVGLPLLTIALVSIRSSLATESFLMIYLLAVVVVAVVGGVVPALLAAVGSFLLVNWFLTPPYYTLAVENRNAGIDLFVFIVAAVVVSVTVELVRGLFGMDTVALVGPTDGDSLDSPLAVVGPPPTESPSLSVDATDGLQLVAYGPEIFAEDRRLLGVLAAMASRAWQGQQLAGQAAQAHQLAETDRVRSALLAAVSHDLRTPLAGIKAAVSSLRQEDITWTQEEQRELLLTVEESADRLTDLISNILAMSRIQAGAVSLQVSPVALDEVVARALLGSKASVTVDVPEDLPLVSADAGLLERVVANLVDNADRFSPPGVPVRVHAELPDAANGLDAGAAHAQPAWVRLQVTDHGPGIPESRWGSMFTPFQHFGDHDAGAGLGLGLAIAQGFTQAMHAQLTPSATPGGGLTMTITLPVAAPPVVG